MTERYLLRCAKIEVTAPFLEDFLKGNFKEFQSNVPQDIQLFGIDFDVSRQVYIFLCASKDFAVVPEGAIPPKFNVVCKEK